MATSGPSSSLRKRRKDKFLRAVLAGATFERKRVTEGAPPGHTDMLRPGWRNKWFIDLPPHRVRARGYVGGPFRWRHLAVDAAMFVMELE